MLCCELNERASQRRAGSIEGLKLSIQDLGSIGELIGAIATVATLAYLALQIRQSTKVAEMSAITARVDQRTHQAPAS